MNSFETADQFFTLDPAVKQKYARKSKSDVTGWDEYGREMWVSFIQHFSIISSNSIPSFCAVKRFT